MYKKCTHSKLVNEAAIFAGYLSFHQKFYKGPPQNVVMCGLLCYAVGKMHIASLLQSAFERKVSKYCDMVSEEDSHCLVTAS
jgi:hypothetical protein